MQSIRGLTAGVRKDLYVLLASPQLPATLKKEPNQDERFLTARAEFVHDNSIAPAMNIWNGIRFKGWFELFNRMGNILATAEMTRAILHLM